MIKRLVLIVCFLFFNKGQTQNYLNTYYPLGTNDTIQNPSIIPTLSNCGMITPLKIGSNNDFRVRVKNNPTDNWQDLFEYNVFVNSSSGDLLGVTRSSFVSFDYSGTVIIEIKCNGFSDNPSSPYSVKPENVIIRPQSRVINRQVSGQIITFTLTTPSLNDTGKEFSDKFSVEINGNRYRNLQIFANRKFTPPTNTIFTHIYSASNNDTNIYPIELNNTNKKIKIEKGAILRVPYEGPAYSDTNGKIKLNDGDEIYIEGGGVLNGGLIAEDKSQIKIYGRGIIDLTNYPKKLDQSDLNDYAWTQPLTFRRCKNITLDGLIVNDSQQLIVELTDCGGTTADAIDNININNMKLFSHAILGDGYHMRGTSNVAINDCFNRTSDDCISIYASRRLSWDLCDDTYLNQPYEAPEPNTNYPALIPCATTNAKPYLNRDALNIKVTNTLLYADNAHAIEIGWHGNQLLNNGKDIYNLHFENIDILEHDQNWSQPNKDINRTYDGAIGINCSDDNKCSNFLFKDIRIEDFTSGAILHVRVMPYGEGDAIKSGKIVQDIRFENVLYTGTGENKSIIKGVNCDRFVNGVHFENFIIKTSNNATTNLITNYNWLNYFDTNEFAYNITFQEANNYTPNAISNGLYRIKNVSSPPFYLQLNNSISPYYTNSSSALTSNTIWKIEKVSGVEHYVIKPYDNLSNALENSFTKTIPTAPNTSCNGRYLTTTTYDAVKTNQQWKVLGNSSSGFYIINAYSRGYLTLLKGTNNNLVSETNTITLPREFVNNSIINTQKWKFIPYISPLNEVKDANFENSNIKLSSNESIQIYPNPATTLLSITIIKNLIDTKVEIIDLNGKILIQHKLINETTELNIENLPKGLYLVKIINNLEEVYSRKIIKK